MAGAVRGFRHRPHVQVNLWTKRERDPVVRSSSSSLQSTRRYILNQRKA